MEPVPRLGFDPKSLAHQSGLATPKIAALVGIAVRLGLFLLAKPD